MQITHRCRGRLRQGHVFSYIIYIPTYHIKKNHLNLLLLPYFSHGLYFILFSFYLLTSFGVDNLNDDVKCARSRKNDEFNGRGDIDIIIITAITENMREIYIMRIISNFTFTFLFDDGILLYIILYKIVAAILLYLLNNDTDEMNNIIKCANSSKKKKNLYVFY